MITKKGLSRSECGKLGAIASKEKIEKLKQERINNYNLNPKLCKTCHNPLSYLKRKNDFCSHTCSAKFNNVGTCRHGTPRTTFECLNCGKKLSGKQHKFCSHRCQRQIEYQERLKIVQEGGDWRKGWNHAGTIRRELLNIRGHQCEICHATEWMNQPIALVVDHKDGNSDNWRDDNLRLICCNCDAQTPTYKSKNRGNGRYNRRKRYQEEKVLKCPASIKLMH